MEPIDPGGTEEWITEDLRPHLDVVQLISHKLTTDHVVSEEDLTLLTEHWAELLLARAELPGGTVRDHLDVVLNGLSVMSGHITLGPPDGAP